jgi:hypothetical protein
VIKVGKTIAKQIAKKSLRRELSGKVSPLEFDSAIWFVLFPIERL